MKSILITLILNQIIFLWSLVGLCTSQISTNETDVNNDLKNQSLLETEQISNGKIVMLSIGGITWNNSKGALWANQCDFTDNDLLSINMSKDNCAGVCRNTPNCTHFTWKNATCHMKSGSVWQSDAFKSTEDVNMTCGILTTQSKKN